MSERNHLGRGIYHYCDQKFYLDSSEYTKEDLKYLVFRIIADKIDDDLTCLFEPDKELHHPKSKKTTMEAYFIAPHNVPVNIINPYTPPKKILTTHLPDFQNYNSFLFNINRLMLERMIYRWDTINILRNEIEAFENNIVHHDIEDKGAVVYFLVFFYMYLYKKRKETMPEEFHRLICDFVDWQLDQFIDIIQNQILLNEEEKIEDAIMPL